MQQTLGISSNTCFAGSLILLLKASYVLQLRLYSALSQLAIYIIHKVNMMTDAKPHNDMHSLVVNHIKLCICIQLCSYCKPSVTLYIAIFIYNWQLLAGKYLLCYKNSYTAKSSYIRSYIFMNSSVLQLVWVDWSYMS